jgi:hypothetical protein
MTITPEQEMELAKFPEMLRFLIETELASGNTIIEVGHSFPAPPAGAYIKLAKKVSTRARADCDGLSFYERNSSSYSGEFTDAQRFYFVLEPPNPPPAELDMDAIRKSYEPQSNLLELDFRASHSQDGEAGLDSTIGTPNEREASPVKDPNVDADSSQVLQIEESATGATRVLYFRDKRLPREVQFAMERELRTLFTPSMEDGKFCLRAKAIVVGADYDFLLCFEAALPDWNCYSLRANVLWGELPSGHADYYRKTAGSWFASWTRAFVAANRPLVNEGSAERYRQLCEEGLNAEKQLDSVAAIQQTIIAAMKDGARFCDSHKEGGTNIFWKGEQFVRSDYGDNPDKQHFTDEIEFLKMLRQFCHWDVTRNSGKDQLSEIDTWRLIMRRMDPN